MILRAVFVAIASLLLAVSSYASPPQPPDREAFEQAIKECESSVTKEKNGRPDHQAMDTCMEEKGFSKPAGKPGVDGPPPQD